MRNDFNTTVNDNGGDGGGGDGSNNNKGIPSENASNSSSSNGEGGGNNSDNSAIISLGNTSFGFNFDSEEGNNSSSPRNSSGNSEGGDSDQDGKQPKQPSSNKSKVQKQLQQQQQKHHRQGPVQPNQSQSQQQMQQQQQQQQQQSHMEKPHPELATSDLPPRPTTQRVSETLSAGAAAARISSGSSRATSSSGTSSCNTKSSSHSDAAEAAVAGLQSIADASNRAASNLGEKLSLKRKAPDSIADNDSGGYNSDDDEGRSGRLAGSSIGVKEEGDESIMDEYDDGYSDQGDGRKGPRRKKQLDNMKREERNAREKERSFRISRQINELRNLLSSGGVIVPKGTKSSVLTEAANYIRMLQQHQYRSEIDRHQLVQQIQMIGGGALGQPAATAVRHVAAQNGVWSLGNFGGVPPKSAMMYHQSGTNPTTGSDNASSAESDGQGSQDSGVLPSKIEETDYRHVFNSCTVGMAIASMGGAFIDCNKLFCQLSSYSKQEVCAMTVFNLTARQDLQPAFDLISQMLSAPSDPNASSTSCVLRGSFKHRTDLGLNVTLIKGEDGVAKCFCVTLILSPSSPYDTSRPVPATMDLLNSPSQIQSMSKDPSQAGMDPMPAYTAG